MTSSDLTSTVRSAPPGAAQPSATPRAGLALPSSPPAGPRASAPDVVATVTGALPVVVSVTAVVVTRGGSPFLRRTLAAVNAQTSAPDAVVVVDAASGGAAGQYPDLHLGEARFVAAPRARSFGDAVSTALSHVQAGTWLWLLHDDSAPAPDALAELLRAVEHSVAVGVAGPKQERWEPGTSPEAADPFAAGTPGRLVEVGFTTTPLGRRLTGIDDDEIDQGQHDARDDVLAVGLAGALVRRTVWEQLGGTDPEYGPFGDGLDLCRRARLAGHRVIVVPSAVVRHAQASLLGLRDRPARRDGAFPEPDPEASYVQRRRAHLHSRLTGVAAPWVPFVALAMLVAAPFHAMYRLLVKQPGHARDEVVAPLWALARVGPVVRARRAARRTRRLPRSTLRPLRGTWRQVVAERRDRRLARAELRRTAWAPTDIERRELRALALRRRAGLAGAALALAAFSAVVFGPLVGVLFSGGRLVGGALLPAGSTVGDAWRAATTGWVTTGLGAPVLLPAGLLALVVVALGVRRHRRYLALVPVPAVVLFAPFLVHVARTWPDGGWRLLLADPGAPVASAGAEPWQLLLGLPTVPAPWFGQEGGQTLDLLARWGPSVAGAVVVALAVVAVLRGRRVAAGAWFVAAVGLAAAVLASRTTVAGVSLLLLALLAAALVGAPALPAHGAPAWRTGCVVALAVVVTLLPLGGAASWTAGVLDRSGASVGAVRATAEPVVPPAGRQMQTSPRQARVLTLEVGDDGVVDYAALRGDGPQAVDASAVVHLWEAADPGVVQGDLPAVAAGLAAGTAEDAAGRLARLGVGAVLVPASAPADQARAELVARLDMVPGLERMTEGDSGLTWRVAPEDAEPAYARLEGPDGDVRPLDADRGALRPVDVAVGPGAPGRLVVLAENAAPGWRATLDGRALEAVDPATTGGLQAFELDADGGRLAVYHATDHRSGWMTAAGVVLLVYVLLAVPVRRRRPVAR
jgi:GT2 family glycosyltransferase